MRVEHQLSVRDVAGLLKNELISQYGTNITRVVISKRTQAAIDKHDGVQCDCIARNRDCRGYRSKLVIASRNRTSLVFEPWFTPLEIENYLIYARGEKGLGEFKSYFEDIEKRAIRAGLILGLIKPLKKRLVVLDNDDDSRTADQYDRDIKNEIIETEGKSIGGHIKATKLKTKGDRWVPKPLASFDKAPKLDATDLWISRRIQEVGKNSAHNLGHQSVQFRHARKTLDELFEASENPKIAA